MHWSCTTNEWDPFHRTPKPTCCKPKALDIALCTTLSNQLQIRHIFTASKEILQVLNPINNTITWRFSPAITAVNLHLEQAGHPKIVVVPRSWLSPATSLAVLGANLHCLNLFLTGRDLTRCVMKGFIDAGFFIWVFPQFLSFQCYF